MTAQIIEFPYNARRLHRGMVVDAHSTPAEVVTLPVIPFVSPRYDGVRVPDPE